MINFFLIGAAYHCRARSDMWTSVNNNEHETVKSENLNPFISFWLFILVCTVDCYNNGLQWMTSPCVHFLCNVTCYSSYQEVGSISPSFECGLALWLPGSIKCDKVIVCDLLPRLSLKMPYNFCFDPLRTLSSSCKVAWFTVIKDERPCGETQTRFNTNNRKWEWGHLGTICPYWSTSYPKRWMSPPNTRGVGGFPSWGQLYDFVIYNETDS